MKMFSIIIPCYNSFDKMQKCLEMLEKQSYKDFEVIIVDDCSNDNSYKLLDEYKNKSNISIRLFRNSENHGAGFTRNVGIQNSSGKYLLFIDSDDYVSEDILKIAKNFIDKENLDCFVFDYYKCDGDKKASVSMIPDECNGIISVENAFKFVKGCTCGKIYKSEIIKENNICFSCAVRNEDMPFTKVAMSFCNNIYYYNEKPLYYYVMNSNSLMHNKKLLDENNALDSFKIVENNCRNEFKECLEIIFIKECLYSMLSTMIVKKYKKHVIKNKLRSISSNYPEWYKNKDITKLGKVVNVILFLYKKSLFIAIRFIFFLKGVIYD